MQRDNNDHSLATYVSDMLALERHVRVPFETQAKDDDFFKFDQAGQLVQGLVSACDDHIDRLDRCLEQLGGHEASPVKSAVTQIEGFFAGAIDKMRKTKVSKALRDDYTALALCCAGYSALLATANGLGRTEIAAMAHELLQDYAGMVMQIGEALPAVVVQELQASTDLNVDTSTANESRQRITSAWRGGSRTVDTSTTTGTIGGTGRPVGMGQNPTV